jgi:Family of unknown function (DUF6765)
MDKDFHYYGTYVAARIAKFSTEDATTIAHAAQYVDNSIKVDGMILNGIDYGLSFRHIPTCHDPLKELKWNTNLISASKIPKLPEKELRQVWVPFHFLPGNYKSTNLPDPNYESRKKDYTWPPKLAIRTSSSGLEME